MPMLPYKTAPKAPTKTIGAEDIGELELPVYYGLTVNEKNYIDELTKELPDTQKMLVQFAEKLSAELSKIAKQKAEEDGVPFEFSKYSVSSIANEIINGISDDLRKYIYAYHQKEFEELREQFAERNKAERAAYASAMIVYRLGVSDWKPEYVNDPDMIRPPLVDELFKFAIREELNFRDTKEEKEGQKLTEEMVGKSAKASPRK